jgi:hypothetical protein
MEEMTDKMKAMLKEVENRDLGCGKSILLESKRNPVTS